MAAGARIAVALNDRRRHDGLPPRSARRQHTVVQDQIDPRSRHECGQALQELHRIKHQVRRAIRPPAPQVPHHLALPREAQTLLPYRRTQRIPAHALQSLTCACWHSHSGVEIEATHPRVPWTRRVVLPVLKPVVTPSARWSTGPWPQRRHATHRRRRQPSPRRRVVGKRIPPIQGITTIHNAAPGQQPPQSSRDRDEQRQQI